MGARSCPVRNVNPSTGDVANRLASVRLVKNTEISRRLLRLDNEGWELV